MRYKRICLVLLLLLVLETQAQKADTIIVYETVMIYDTVKVFDTVFVEEAKLPNSDITENVFKKNNSVQNAVLIVDTATQKAELLLFNKNDTATISINSIILSETNKNLGTMKKQILTLAAAVMLAQPNFAQDANSENKTNDASPQTKHQIGAGISWKGIKNLGGNFNYMYYISPKLGIGGRLVATDYKYSDFHGTSLNVHYTGGLFYDVSLAVNYFLLGNHDGKAGMYVAGGIGYGSTTINSIESWSGPYPEAVSYNTKDMTNGLSGNFTLGGTYKAGPGRLFLELNLSLIIYGTQNHTETFPDGYSGISNQDWRNTRFGVGYNASVINVGYAFAF